MHADGKRQAVEGLLSKDMPTNDEFLQTWKLNLSTTEKLSVIFHHNKKKLNTR